MVSARCGGSTYLLQHLRKIIWCQCVNAQVSCDVQASQRVTDAGHVVAAPLDPPSVSSVAVVKRDSNEHRWANMMQAGFKNEALRGQRVPRPTKEVSHLRCYGR